MLMERRKTRLQCVLTLRMLYKILLKLVKLSVHNARSPYCEFCGPAKQKKNALNISEVPIQLSTTQVFVNFSSPLLLLLCTP
jgi:hypothetical protein